MKKIIMVSMMLFSGLAIGADLQSERQNRRTFDANCSTCHKVNSSIAWEKVSESNLNNRKKLTLKIINRKFCSEVPGVGQYTYDKNSSYNYFSADDFAKFILEVR